MLRATNFNKLWKRFLDIIQYKTIQTLDNKVKFSWNLQIIP